MRVAFECARIMKSQIPSNSGLSISLLTCSFVCFRLEVGLRYVHQRDSQGSWMSRFLTVLLCVVFREIAKIEKNLKM